MSSAGEVSGLSAHILRAIAKWGLFPAVDAGMTPFTINGRFLTRTVTGVDRFAFELTKKWLGKVGASNVSLAMPRVPKLLSAEASCSLPIPNTWYGHLSGHPWEQIELPSMSRDTVLINLCNSAPMTQKRQLVVLHDAGVRATPQSYGARYRLWHSFLTSQLIRRASAFATVSEFSADEIKRLFGIRPKGLEIVHESGEHILDQSEDLEVISSLKLSGVRYVLVVGSSNPNKNLGAIVKAMSLISRSDVRLVVTGKPNPRVFTAATGDVHSYISSGYVNDRQLRALYSHAQCFVFPSYYEGFGLPPLEAMHCGCPVLVSDRASMPEICGSAAVYFDPADSDDLAKKLRRVLNSEDLRQELREAGYLRASQFTWTRAATQLEDILSRNFG